MSRDCKQGKHNLKEVSCDVHWSGSELIIRWCKECGTIFRTTEMDGRVFKREFMSPSLFLKAN